MKAYRSGTGLVAPLDRDNVDTDAILPKQFMKSVLRTGLGPFLFDSWRYLDSGALGMDCSTRLLNAQFEPNALRYRGASILLSRKNFGCGSSREHAPWALAEAGFRTLIAESFAEIFRDNCLANGLLTIELPGAVIADLFDRTRQAPGFSLQVDLEQACLVMPDRTRIAFAIEQARQERLLIGQDAIDLTLQHAGRVAQFEQQRKQIRPWLYR
jgi:3-isopropylmalate/(R)-2-methylmalate dehydratase small subunit